MEIDSIAGLLGLFLNKDISYSSEKNVQKCYVSDPLSQRVKKSKIRLLQR